MRLVAACCRWPRDEANVAAVEAAAAAPLDWDHFLHLVQRHRVAGLVWSGLRSAKADVPGHVADALAKQAAEIGTRNLAHAAEEARLYKAFGDAGLEICFVKGTTLGKLAYGTLSLKAAADIDLLVDTRDAESSSALLLSLGYERRIPDGKFSEAQFRRWRAHSKESAWIQPKRGTIVELHTALVANAALLRALGADGPRQMVEIGEGVRLPTLAADRLLTYLCVHGTSHHWSRFKWLADTAAFASREGMGLEACYRSSGPDSPRRSVALTIVLCHRLLGMEADPALLTELRADFGLHILERISLDAMEVSRRPRSPIARLAAFARLLLSFFLVERGWRHFLAEARRRAFFPYSENYLYLPTWLWPLLTLVQMPRLMLKRMGLKLV